MSAARLTEYLIEFIIIIIIITTAHLSTAFGCLQISVLYITTVFYNRVSEAMVNRVFYTEGGSFQRTNPQQRRGKPILKL